MSIFSDNEISKGQISKNKFLFSNKLVQLFKLGFVFFQNIFLGSLILFVKE